MELIHYTPTRQGKRWRERLMKSSFWFPLVQGALSWELAFEEERFIPPTVVHVGGTCSMMPLSTTRLLLQTCCLGGNSRVCEEHAWYDITKRNGSTIHLNQGFQIPRNLKLQRVWVVVATIESKADVNADMAAKKAQRWYGIGVVHVTEEDRREVVGEPRSGPIC
jgi:hypothetical protein